MEPVHDAIDGGLIIDPDALVRFLLEAKRGTYAAPRDDASVRPVLSGSKHLEFRSGDFLYRDISYGFGYLVRQEAGPSAFGASPLAYRNTLRVGVESFTGYEAITRYGAVVYALDHSGGVIR